MTEEDLFAAGWDVYEKLHVTAITDRVVNVMPGEKEVILAGGKHIKFDSLLIASGGRPIKLPWVGMDLQGVFTFYSLEDENAVDAWIKGAKNAVIIGAGTIAMKLVPALEKRGLSVTLVEKFPEIIQELADKNVANIVVSELASRGVTVLPNSEVIGFKGQDGRVNAVLLKNKQEVPCDVAIITIGISPNIDFLRNSGIQVDKGVIVNDHLQTNIPAIYAAGDVAQTYDPLFKTHRLHPKWGHAGDQGNIAGQNMAGADTRYEGAIYTTKVKAYKVGIAAGGNLQIAPDVEIVSRFSSEEKFYRKFFFRGTLLVGAIIVGYELPRKKAVKWLKKVLKASVKGANLIIDRQNILADTFAFE